MILFRLAKWMEERASLHRKIYEAGEDPTQLLAAKEKIDEQLLAHANQWLAAESGHYFYDNEESI